MMNSFHFSVRFSDAPPFDRAVGHGFVTGAVYTADPALQTPETGSGFVPLWWYAGRPLTEAVPTADGAVSAPSPAVRAADLSGRQLPLWYRVEVPQEGVYRARAVLCGTGGDAMLFSGRRRLVWRGTLAPGARCTVETLCDVFPIVPRGKADPEPCTAVNLTAVGAAALSEVQIDAAPDTRRVWVCGDSTVTDQTADVPYAPGTSYSGWGQMLPAYLPAPLCVSNHAHSGLTTESFTGEGHWDIVRPRLRAGDICLLQFGHNDQKLPHLQAYRGYTERLHRYLDDIRAAGAAPVLLTPLARNSWAGPKRYNDLLADFAAAVLALGKAEGVPVVDLHGYAMRLIGEEGLEHAKRWFFPGDFTHTNDFGAYKMAGFVADELCRLFGAAPLPCPAWEPQPPFVQAEPPADCALTPPEGCADLFAAYDAQRPDALLTRVEALQLSITALRYFPINVYNDLYTDVVGHETYAGTVQCAAQNGLVPAAWTADGRLHPDAAVTKADFLAVLMPGYAGRRQLGLPAAVPDSIPPYARESAGLALAEALTEDAAWNEPLTRRAAAAICRRLKL